MNKSLILSFATAMGGGITYFLRKQQIAQVLDPVTLLYESDAPETLMLNLWTLCFVLALGGYLLSGGRPLPNYIYTVYCPSYLFLGAVALGSLLLMLSIFVSGMDIYHQYTQFIPIGTESKYVFPFLTIIGNILVAMVGGFMLYLGKGAYQGLPLQHCWITTTPAYLCVVRLVLSHREYGALPCIEDKLYPIVGGLCLCFAYYHLSATAYINARPRRILFFALTSVVMNGATLAAEESLYHIFIHLGLNLYMLAFAGAIFQNTYISRKDYFTPPPPDMVEERSLLDLFEK